MPLFGKKKDEKSEKPAGGAGYPTQASAPAYPTQGQPPMQQAAAPPQYGAPPQGYAPQGQPPQGYAPQGYAPQGYAPPPNPAYPGGPGAPPTYQGPPPPYQQNAAPPPQPYYPNQVPQQRPQQTVVVQGGYDAGARFDGVAQANIPPPPPGCMPNAAQMAAMQGSNVVMTQRQGDFFTGGSDGGYTIW